MSLRTTGLFTDSSLKAYYEVESGALVTDSKGTYTLVNYNSVAEATGKFGNGANFNGAGSNQALGSGVSLGLTGTSAGAGCSMVGWYSGNSAIASGDIRRFILRTDDQASFTGLFLDYQYNGGTPRLNFERSREFVADDSVFATVTLGTGVFYHLAVTWDGAKVSGYLNGTLQGTVASAGNGNTTGFNNILLGNSGTASVNQADGIVDDAAFFGRALSSVEIGTLYNDTPAPSAGRFMTTNTKFW